MLSKLKNRNGQGTTEYIVIIAIAVALAITLFWGPLKNVLNPAIGRITSGITNAQ